MTNAEEQQEAVVLPHSCLVAECGSVNTTVSLFDEAAGSYRLLARAIAPTTVGLPWRNLAEGVYLAVQSLEQQTGRSLLNPQRKLITPARQHNVGVDQFIAVSSAAPPLATALVGLFDDVSLASARRVLGSANAQEVSCLSLDAEQEAETYLATLLEKEPDLIFIVGGTDGGATKRLLHLVETVSLAVGPLAEKKQIQAIFAGNKQLRQPVSALLKGRVELHMAENVRPNLETERLADATREVNDLYSDFKIGALPGSSVLHDWSEQHIIPTVQAFATLVRFVAALQKGRVLGVDLGGSSVSLVMADAHGAQIYRRNDLGIGQMISNVLNEVEPATIARWLPFAASDEEIRDFIWQKSLQPQTIPLMEEEIYLEQAIAREIIRRVVPANLPPFDVLLARGQTLTNTPRPGQAVLLLLDALQPTGIFSVALDKYGVLPALGAMSGSQPLAVVQALEAGVLADLGWVIALTGKGQAGESAVKGSVETAEGQFNLDVAHGQIDTTVLGAGQTASISLTPDKRVDLGFGSGKGKKLSVRGGLVGLVVDARGRPLLLPEPEQRIEQIRKWYWDVGS
jgi:hypothetical protein